MKQVGRVYAVTTDEHWRRALEQVSDASFRLDTLYCPEGYPGCLDRLPDADPGGLLLVDATGLPDVADTVRRLRERGWRYVVAVAADPSARETASVFKARGHDYWVKTFEVDRILRQVKDCLRQIERSVQENRTASET